MGITDFTNKYPYTDFHELNLDWIIKRYTELSEKVDTLKTWVSQHQEDYEEAMTRLEAVENEINTFEQQITAQFEQLKAQQEADFAQQKAELEAALIQTKAEVDAELAQLQEDVATAIAGFENQFKTLETSILNEVAQLKVDVRREVTEFYDVMQANNEYVFTYVENRLDEFIKSLPEILTVMVYNPYRGQVTDIQTAINDLYEVAAIWGLTASQYDSLGLTASEYDALDLTAREYDTLGYKLLYKDPAHYMISPFTGEYVPLQEVIDKLAQFHMEGLTASEYDAKDLTAEGYDALDLTAFNYDWFASQLIA